MNMVIIVEIVVGIVVFAGAVRFAVRDARQRRPASLEQQSEPAHTPPAHAPEVQTFEVQERTSERDAERHPSEVADRT
jgi:flagellar biosynthesis/type III secretory pathway M-ring protein FliF/YscJ